MVGPTRDHEEIRRWARSCHAVPVEVYTRTFDGEPTQLRFVFGEAATASMGEMRPISWDQFFAIFEMMGLALAYGQGERYEIRQMDKRPRVLVDGRVH